MPATRTLQRSFAGGEMSPEMFGRIDDAKYQSGLALCKNFITKPQGPAENRAGFKFVNEVKDSTKITRLIPFTYSTTQTMVIELGAGYFRFHTQGSTLEVGNPPAYRAPATVTMTIASPCVVTLSSHGMSNGDRIIFSTTGALPTGITAGTVYYVLNAATNTFQVAATSGGAAINTSGTQSGVHTVTRSYVVGDLVRQSSVNYYCIADHSNQAPPNVTYWYVIPSSAYEIPNVYAEADLFDIHYVQSADVLTLVHPNYAPRELRRQGATNWVLNTISFQPNLSAPTGVTATPSGSTTPKYTYTYVVTSIGADLVSESSQSSTATCTGNLLETGGIVTIAWTAVAGATRYSVYKLQGGVYGYIGQTTSTSIVDDNIGPDLSTSPPTYESVFQSALNYPGAVSYYEQRRCFAGTLLEPQKIWMTKSGTESDMSYSLPIRDDDRISFRVAAREANTIRHIVPLTQLLLLTSSAEWRVTSVNSDAITPSTISVRPQSYVGASNVQPVIINNTLIYGAARGGHVRELGYNWQANGFITGDMSLRSAHLFDNYDITDMAYSKAPQPIIWMISTSGKLLGLTYVPEQSVGAWHQHDTDGSFQTCTVVAEGNEDVLYVVIKRTINGVSKRYIERLNTRLFARQQDAFFVDCGATYDGTNTTATTVTLTGGTTWSSTELLTLTSSTPIFTVGSGDINDEIVVYSTIDNSEYHLRINSVASTTSVQVRTDKTIPSYLRNAATTKWSFARNSISGLSHIEGKTVNILADGAVHPQRVVTSGQISLDRPISIAHIGLPITADIQTLPMAAGVDTAAAQGIYKNVNEVAIRVYRSSGIFIGPSLDRLVEAKQRRNEPYGSPPALKTEEIKTMIKPSWNDGGQIYVRQIDPLPLTIINMTMSIQMGG